MIVDTMTHAEVYRELDKDRVNVLRWWQHQWRDMYRATLKRKQFPWRQWTTYTSPRGNTFIILSIALTRNFRKTGSHTLMALRKVPRGYEGYTMSLIPDSDITPTVLLPHMYRRYAERMGMDASTPMMDIIKTFHERNSNGWVSREEKAMGGSVRYNGEEHVAVCLSDGIMLGHIEGDIYKVKTFITYDMTSGLQGAEFIGNQQRVLSEMELARSTRRRYSTTTIYIKK